MPEDLMDDNNFQGNPADTQPNPLEESGSDKEMEGIPQTEGPEVKPVEPIPEQSKESAISKIKSGISDAANNINEATGSHLFTPYADTLPSMEDFLGSSDYSIPKAVKGIITGDFSNPEAKAIMDKTLPGRIAQQIGGAVSNAYKGTLGIETGSYVDKTLKDAGVFNDIEKNRNNFFKSVNEAFIRPAATAIDVGWRTANAIISGVGAGIEQAATETGGAAPEMAEWAMTDISAIQGMMPHVPKPSDVSQATEMAVYDGHNAYFGLDIPTREQQFARIEASRTTEELKNFVARKQGIEPNAPEEIETAAEEPVPGIAEVPKNIHDIAREIAPDTFTQFDDLKNKRENLRGWIDDLAASRDKGAQGQIDDLLSKVNGVEDRLTKKQAAKLEELRNLPDTADMTAIRSQIAKYDSQMRDLAEPVSAAYREAEMHMPKEETPTESQTQESQNQPKEQITNTEKPIENKEIENNVNETVKPTEAETALEIPVEKQLSNISQDVINKLRLAGRPEEEANYASQLIAQRYKSIAEQGWAKGTPEEIYKRDAANIVSGVGEKTSNMKRVAQGKRDIAKGFYSRETNTIHLMERADASTFIHETGHAWLEEMMRYGKETDAPESLTRSIESIDKWLGKEKNAKITGRQHEKFARGFERYLMEGIAPSQELAGVFAKFKKWLTDIYQTVQKLRAPITDDIRAVFDRMLSSKPEKIVIAPEAESAKIIENLHEKQAESTLPIKAAEVGDNVRATVDRLAKAHEPELYNELQRARPQEGAPDNAGAAANIAEGSSTTEPGSGTPNPIKQPSEVNPGGVKTAPEGDTVPSRRIESPEEKANTENKSVFEENKSKYIDKAGNIRLDLLNVGDDIKQAIRDAAERNSNFTDWTRGVITDSEAFSLAEASGMKASDLDKFQIGRAYTKEELFQLQKLLNDASADVAKATLELKTAKTDDARLAFAETLERFKLIQDQVQARRAGASAEAGRALQAHSALRKMAGSLESEALSRLLKEQTGTDLYQLDKIADAISELDTPGKVAGFIEEIRKPSRGDKLFEVFTNWLISNPITHKIYAEGNAILALFKATAETATEAGVGFLKEKITGEKQERVYLGEVKAQLYAMYKGQRDGWAAAQGAFKAGQTIQLPHEALDMMTQSQRKIYDASRAEGKTYEEALAAAGGNSPVKTPFTQTQAISGKVGTLVRLPGERMVAPIHSYFRTIGYTQSIARQAFRAAMDAGLEDHAFNSRVAELKLRPTEEMMTEARREATEQTLMGKGGDFTKKVTNLVNWEANVPGLGNTRPLRFIDPFVHIQANMFEQGTLSRTPLGLLSSKIRDDIIGKNGSLLQDRAIARMALGTSLSIAAGGLAMEGLITPSAPSDPKEAAMWQMVHGMPHSFTIGDMSYDLQKLGPLGLNIGIAADLYHAASRIGKDDASKVASLLVHSFSKNFLDEGFMRGPADFMKVMENPDRYGEKYIKNFTANIVVPYSMGTGAIAHIIDPYSRESRTVMDGIKAKIPWWSETLMPRVDIWGEPVLNRETGWLSYQQKMTNDPVNSRLYNLGVFPPLPKRQILGVQLTDQQYHEYAVKAGQMAKQELDRYVQTTAHVSIAPGADIAMIHRIIRDARTAAAGAIVQSYPQIQRTATANKQSILETGKKVKIQE